MLGRMLIGQASLKNLSGPLTIADYAGPVGRSQVWRTTWASWPWSASASGVLNLLPLPMLDGGT